jgi:hypothetical protein
MLFPFPKTEMNEVPIKHITGPARIFHEEQKKDRQLLPEGLWLLVSDTKRQKNRLCQSELSDPVAKACRQHNEDLSTTGDSDGWLLMVMGKASQTLL